MRQQYTLDSTAPGEAINLPWTATTVLILNPTAKTLYIRVGGNDIPATAAAASITCPAGYAMAWPCVGPTFGVGFGLPQLAVQPDGMPTTAVLYFLDASEAAPSFAPMPLDTLQAAITNTVNVNLTNANINATITNSSIDVNLTNANINATITNSSIDANITNSTINAVGLLAQETLIASGNAFAPGGGTIDRTIAPPAGTRSLSLIYPAIASGIHTSVSGVQSGLSYLSVAPGTPLPTTPMRFTMPVLSSQDTSIRLQAQLEVGSVGDAYFLFAHGGEAPRETDLSGVPLVRLSPGNGAAVASSGQAITPAAFATFLTSGPLPAGRYRVVAGAYSDDTPGVGKRILLIGPGMQAAGPVGAQLSWDWPDIAVAGGGTVFMENGAAGGAGTLYTGWLLLYLIS